MLVIAEKLPVNIGDDWLINILTSVTPTYIATRSKFERKGVGKISAYNVKSNVHKKETKLLNSSLCNVRFWW